MTIAIPTYGREAILIDTVEALLRHSVSQILVVDQSPAHEAATECRLRQLAESGRVRWLRLPQPSIPAAMNAALLTSERPLVLFVDDDVDPDEALVATHATSYEDEGTWAVVGQILQPGEAPGTGRRSFRTQGLRAFLDFPFNSSEPAWVANVMAGNLSVRRQRALEVGGFDENFVGPAYRFETEFCRRLCTAGGRVLFQPRARIRHLRAISGGTRAYGNHLTSTSPVHAVGDYYFALRQGITVESLAYILSRPLREVRTRFHLRRPWWIPLKFIGEARALLWAIRLIAHGPRCLDQTSRHVA